MNRFILMIFSLGIFYSCMENDVPKNRNSIEKETNSIVAIFDKSDALQEIGKIELETPTLTFLQHDYCAEKDSTYSLVVYFKQNEEKIYVFFEIVLRNGRLIMETSEEDYDYFNIEELQENRMVKIDLKNPLLRYHSYDDCEFYQLKLSFDEENKTIDWKITNPQHISNLPSKAVLSICK